MTQPVDELIARPDFPLADPEIISAMLAELESPDFAGGYVVQVPEGKRIEPAELWLPDLHGWVRADGSLLMLDRGRGYFRLTEEAVAALKSRSANHAG